MSVEKLLILHTNDIHSHFEQMPRVAGALKQLRKKHATHHILNLDIGDHLDRMRLETEGSEGVANIAVMNASGYEAVVPGNNEGLTFDKPTLKQLYAKHASFQVIGSNMLDLATGQHPAWLRPYWIVSKGNLRIGLIGLTAAFNDFYRPLGWQMSSPLETAKQLVNTIRQQVDLVIVMSHLGLPLDKQLARTIRGIDCIIGAHTHHLLLEPLFIEETMLCAAGKFGHYVGEVEIHYDTAQRQIVYRHATCQPTQSFEPDPLIERLIEEYQQTAREKLSEIIVTLPKGLHHHWSVESEIGNLLAAGLRQWTGAEIGMVSAGQIMANLPAGPISREILLELCPSPINPCRMKLTGADILQVLEEALLAEVVNQPIIGFGFRGKVLGTLCVDGMEVFYDDTRPAYNKILQVTVQGAPLNLQRKYSVGTIDMLTFGVGYPIFKGGEEFKFFMPEFIRDVLAHQLQNPNEIRKASVKRWISNEKR